MPAVISNKELARKFNRVWDGSPIEVLTRKKLAYDLNVSERTLRRWEKKGIIEKPYNCIQGAGRGNLAVYRNPMEGIVSILVRKDDVYIRYLNNTIKWRKRRIFIEQEIPGEKKNELV